MSDEEDEGYKGPLHPRLTMDDITEVSGPEEIERKNTFQITKNTEARSKTVFSVIVGALAGLALCLIFAPLLGYMFSSFFVLLAEYWLRSSQSAPLETAPNRHGGREPCRI